MFMGIMQEFFFCQTFATSFVSSFAFRQVHLARSSLSLTVLSHLYYYVGCDITSDLKSDLISEEINR